MQRRLLDTIYQKADMMQKNIAKFVALTSVLLCLVAFVGCGKGDGLCAIEGTVTLDGQPIQDGFIGFGPKAGQQGTMAGAQIKEGKYAARVSEGEMVVSVRAQKKETVNDPDHGQVVNLIDLPIPEKYSSKSEQTVIVKPGKNTYNLDIVSEK